MKNNFRKLISILTAGILVLVMVFSVAGIVGIAGSESMFAALGSDGGAGTGSDGETIGSDGETKVDISAAKVTIAAQTYTGKALTPAVKVELNGKSLAEDTDFTVGTYSNNKNAGTASVTIAGKGNYKGEKKASFTINKAANKLTAKAKTATVKYSAVKKKNQTVALKSVCTVSKNNGKVTCKKTSGNKKITVASSGKVTVKKGLKKGTYSVKMKVTAAGDSNHKSGSKTVTFKIKVK